MLYLTCTIISSVELARYGVCRAKDRVSRVKDMGSRDFGTNFIPFNDCISRYDWTSHAVQVVIVVLKKDFFSFLYIIMLTRWSCIFFQTLSSANLFVYLSLCKKFMQIDREIGKSPHCIIIKQEGPSSYHALKTVNCHWNLKQSIGQCQAESLENSVCFFRMFYGLVCCFATCSKSVHTLSLQI